MEDLLLEKEIERLKLVYEDAKEKACKARLVSLICSLIAIGCMIITLFF